MPQVEQLQSPFIFLCANPNVSIDDLQDCDWDFDPDMEEHFGGGSRFPSFTVGNDKTMISVESTDTKLFTQFIKTMQVIDATIKFKTAYTAAELGVSGPTLLGATVIYGFKISCCRVAESVKVNANGGDKKVSGRKLVLRAAKNLSTGADPVLTFLTS